MKALLKNPHNWLLVFLSLTVLIMSGILLGDLIFQIKHPCIRYGQPKSCIANVSTCDVYAEDGSCVVYGVTEYEYDCTPCLERDMR